jgi:hypothetical protein
VFVLELNIESVEVAYIPDYGYVIKHKIKDVNDAGHEFFKTEVTLVNEPEAVYNQPGQSKRLAMADMLYAIAESFGYVYNKYGTENLNISYDKKGHKVENNAMDKKQTE